MLRGQVLRFRIADLVHWISDRLHLLAHLLYGERDWRGSNDRG